MNLNLNLSPYPTVWSGSKIAVCDSSASSWPWFVPARLPARPRIEDDVVGQDDVVTSSRNNNIPAADVENSLVLVIEVVGD